MAWETTPPPDPRRQAHVEVDRGIRAIRGCGGTTRERESAADLATERIVRYIGAAASVADPKAIWTPLEPSSDAENDTPALRRVRRLLHDLVDETLHEVVGKGKTDRLKLLLAFLDAILLWIAATVDAMPI